MNSTTRAITDLMVQQGFRLTRTGKHQIWRHANGLQLVTSVSCSDRRAFQRARQLVRRLMRTASHQKPHQ